MLTHADASLPSAAGENFITPSLSAYGSMRSKPSALLSLIPKTDAATRLPGRKHLVLDLLGTAEQTCPAGGDETSLLTGNGVARDGRGLSDMLVVTTTVGVIDGVHGNTTSTGPAVALGSELVLSTRRLQEGLVGTSTTGDDTDHTTARAGEDLLGTRRELDTGLALIGVVADDGNVVTRGTAERTTVTVLVLDVGQDGTFGDRVEGKDVADGERSVLSGVDELASVHALVCDESLGVVLELVRVAERDAGERSATTGVVDNLLYDTPDVSIALSEVERAELGGVLVQAGVGREDGSATLTLVANYPTHGDVGVVSRRLSLEARTSPC